MGSVCISFPDVDKVGETAWQLEYRGAPFGYVVEGATALIVSVVFKVDRAMIARVRVSRAFQNCMPCRWGPDIANKGSTK